MGAELNETSRIAREDEKMPPNGPLESAYRYDGGYDLSFFHFRIGCR